jgi:hypothetical protein
MSVLCQNLLLAGVAEQVCFHLLTALSLEQVQAELGAVMSSMAMERASERTSQSG